MGVCKVAQCRQRALTASSISIRTPANGRLPFVVIEGSVVTEGLVSKMRAVEWRRRKMAVNLLIDPDLKKKMDDNVQ